MGARDDIIRRRADFVTAFNREDLAAIEQLCAYDIVMLPSNQPPIVGIRNPLELRIIRAMRKSNSDTESLWAGGIAAFLDDDPRLM